MKSVVIHCSHCVRALGVALFLESYAPNWSEVKCLDCQKNPEGVSLHLKNSSSGDLVSKRVTLSKTVAEFLTQDSLALFPDIVSPPSLIRDYLIRDYVVTLVRTNRLLGHTETLQDAGVQENDTLEIISPNTTLASY